MSFSLLYWILMLLWLVLGFVLYIPSKAYRPFGIHFFSFVMFLLLGWKVFGSPLHGG